MPSPARLTAPDRATKSDTPSPLSTSGLVLRRKCACGGGGAGADGSCDGCRKQKLRRKAAGHGLAPQATTHDVAGAGGESSGGGVPQVVQEVLATAGSPLDPSARAFAESRFGQDFSHVRIHADDRAAESARSVDAHAYTVGSHVVFGAGRYAPSTRGGMHLLAHELAHTVQQRGSAMPGVARLAVGREDDPAEFAADRAADAAMSGGPVPSMASSAGTIRRQRVKPSVEVVNPDEKIVTRTDNSRVRIRRIRFFREAESLVNWARAVPGADRKRVWLDVEWCVGENHATVSVGANVPEKVAQTIVNVLINGQDLKSTLQQLDITPFLSLKMLQSGEFEVTASAEVTVTREGEVTGGAVSGKVTKGPVDVEGKISGEKREGGAPEIKGTIDVIITPGRKTRTEKCQKRKTRIVEGQRFECEKEKIEPEHDEPVDIPVTDLRERFIYFKYEKDVVERSESNIAALTADLAAGFQVTRIRGFTSPEGPMKKEKGNPFIGNIELAKKRAAAAAKVAKASCAAAGKENADACFVGGEAAVPPTGEGELYTLTKLDDKGEVKEVEGKELAEHASGEFVEQKEEEVHRTPEMEAKLRDPKTTSKQKADLVYPLLRRAKIELQRKRTEKGKKKVPEKRTWEPIDSCPEDVVEAAFPEQLSGLQGL